MLSGIEAWRYDKQSKRGEEFPRMARTEIIVNVWVSNPFSNLGMYIKQAIQARKMPSSRGSYRAHTAAS